MKNTLKRIFILAVLTPCMLVLLCTIFLPASPLRGNETALPTPRLFLGGRLNTEFLTELSDWYGQRFAFRSEAITLDALVQSGIFGTSNTDEVIVGQDGWLYYTSTASDYCNARTLSDPALSDIAITLSLLEEAAANAGMEFLFVPAPNKSTIYPDDMPARYQVLEQDGNLEALLPMLDAEQVSYLNLAPLLQGSDALVYHKTDSHWNNLGAATAQLAILSALGREGTDYSAAPFTLQTDFPGDLAAMLYPARDGYDANQLYDLGDMTETGVSDGVLYETETADGEGILYCWRDSFGNALAPFLGAEFERAVFSRAVPYDLREAVAIGADTLILEIAERNIGNLLENAPVFPAPVREGIQPDAIADADVSVETQDADGLLRITGSFAPTLRDPGSRMYAMIGGVCYEVTPTTDGFALYLDAETINPLTLLFYQDGVLTAITE